MHDTELATLLPEKVSRKTEHKGFVTLHVDSLRFPVTGQSHPYTMVELGFDAAIVIATTKDGLFVVNKEYRYPTGHVLLGAPGGRLDPGEEPVVGAKRELQEETGYYSDSMHPIGECFPFPGLCEQKIYYFHAENAELLGAPKRDETEVIETHLMTSEELRKAVTSGHNIDGILCTALSFYMLHCGKTL